LPGSPSRQLIKAGQGDADAGVCVLAFILAGAAAHNFGLAASPSKEIASILEDAEIEWAKILEDDAR
jgi:hypothetical protein